MATLQLSSFNTFVSNAAAAVQASASALLDFTAGSVVRALMEACSGIALWLQYQVVQVLALTRLATSNGSDADSWCADFGFARLPAVYATGSVTFTRYTSTAAAFIAVGAQVKTSDGTQTFSVVADTTNAAYSATLGGFTIAAGTANLTVAVQAMNAGTQGNVSAGSITLFATAISGIDTVTNASALTNGVNAESDAAFRARFVTFINTRTLGTLAAIGYAVQSVEQNLTYTIQEDVSTIGAYDPGNFVVTVDDGSGNPPSSTLTLVSAAVNLARPIGTTFAVQAPSLITATVSFTVTVAAGYTKINMLSTIETAVSAFINALPMGSPLPYSRIPQVVYDSTPGITNLTNLLVNGGTADLGGGVAQVVRSGTVTAS
jgi:uncharacterized phage protein gp47/JayE